MMFQRFLRPDTGLVMVHAGSHKDLTGFIATFGMLAGLSPTPLQRSRLASPWNRQVSNGEMQPADIGFKEMGHD